MNERIQKLAQEAGLYVDLNGRPYPKSMSAEECIAAYQKFAELIVAECARLNKHQYYELLGVITDVEQGSQFDDVCLSTVKRVAMHLATDLKEHFGVEEHDWRIRDCITNT